MASPPVESISSTTWAEDSNGLPVNFWCDPTAFLDDEASSKGSTSSVNSSLKSLQLHSRSDPDHSSAMARKRPDGYKNVTKAMLEVSLVTNISYCRGSLGDQRPVDIHLTSETESPKQEITAGFQGAQRIANQAARRKARDNSHGERRPEFCMQLPQTSMRKLTTVAESRASRVLAVAAFSGAIRSATSFIGSALYKGTNRVC